MRTTGILVFATLLTACGGNPPPETVRYLLRSEQAPVQRSALEPTRISIGRIVIAPYLSQLGIVLETAPGQVRSARHHLWAEPFDQGLRHYLRQALSNEMGVDVSIGPAQEQEWDYLLDVRFEEFHGTGDGNVRMAAEYTWTPTASGGEVQRNLFQDIEPLSGDGYPAMVAAHETLLARLARDMARQVPEQVE